MTGRESRTAAAPAKVNLALVVGPVRPDGRHELVTVLQRVELADEVTVRRAEAVAVDGYAGDTIVAAALDAVRAATGVAFAAHVRKEIPVASGLAGGSSDAATALMLANELLDEPLADDVVHAIAAGLGSDVPFFLAEGPQLGTGDGTELAAQTLPQAFAVVLALAHGAVKESTASVYHAFDARHGEQGFDDRRQRLLDLLGAIAAPADLAALPSNDLASSPVAEELRARGAFRADVTGAGPVVYGLFEDEAAATAACASLADRALTWLTRPRWYR